MGGKGRKRREKNYRAAHGGNSLLPPPPKPSSVDALPSKLRAIMAFTHSSQPGSAVSVSNEKRNGGLDAGNRGDKKLNSKGKLDSNLTGTSEEGNDGKSVTAQQVDDDIDYIIDEKRKKTKKRKRVTDLRFETESSGVGLRRREHRKKRLEAKKNKRKKVRSEDNEGFPRHENIKFGEVVQAPPKLFAFPKALKAPQDASSERLRLKAVEAYRNRKGWASRPGKDLLPPSITSQTL